MAQKMMIAVQVLGQDHGQGAHRVAQQPEDVGQLAADEVADLAADEDERGRDEGLEGDGRLDAADGGVQVRDHGRDGHVHERRVHDQHEHRHGQQQREPRVPCAPDRWGLGCRSCGHAVSAVVVPASSAGRLSVAVPMSRCALTAMRRCCHRLRATLRPPSERTTRSRSRVSRSPVRLSAAADPDRPPVCAGCRHRACLPPTRRITSRCLIRASAAIGGWSGPVPRGRAR